MIVAGTGHRPFQKDKNTGEYISKLAFPGHKGTSRELYMRLTDLAVAWLDKNDEYRSVISGCAMGWDLALANAADYLNRELWMYVPYKGHGEKWTTFYREEHDRLIKEAYIVYAPDVEYNPRHLLQRNKDMVRDADVMLALWDGSEGGTAHCVRYAESKKVPVINLWDQWEKYK
jgi:uncharacterized phage-like protein YoqJ